MRSTDVSVANRPMYMQFKMEAAIFDWPSIYTNDMKLIMFWWASGAASLRFGGFLKILSRNCVLQNSQLLWEFQAEALYLCPTPHFGHVYKVSSWNSHHNCDFWHCIFLWDILQNCRSGVVLQRYTFSVWTLVWLWVPLTNMGNFNPSMDKHSYVHNACEIKLSIHP